VLGATFNLTLSPGAFLAWSAFAGLLGDHARHHLRLFQELLDLDGRPRERPAMVDSRPQ